MSLRRFPLPKAALASAAFLFLAGCAALLDPRAAYDSLAEEQGFSRLVLFEGEARQLRTYWRRGSTRPDLLAVYIEGDGAAWPWPHIAPPDPTPDRPTVLRMADAERAAHVAYIARPCQFLADKQLRRCPVELWTRERFSRRALEPVNLAIDRLKQVTGATQLRIVGYSGGGTLGAMIALARTDVEALYTVASPLHPVEWARFHGVTPVGPDFDLTERLALDRPRLLQVHFVGEKDAIVPPRLNQRLRRAGKVKIIEVPRFTHACCWHAEWPKLLAGISGVPTGEER